MTLIPKDAWDWFGSPAHFIGSRDCRFHLATRVGCVIVSTVGEYLPDSRVREVIAKVKSVKLEGMGDARDADFLKKIGFEKIGCDRLFETMVFRLSSGELCECGCGMPVIASHTELDARGYNTRLDATVGHRELCAVGRSTRKTS